MSLAEKQKALLDEYGVLPDPQERFSYVLEQSLEGPTLEAAERRAENLVEGCQSQVWIVADERDGRMTFRSDSDAPMVKAIAWLLSDFYSGAKCSDILATEPDFLAGLHLLNALTENRRRGTFHIIARIKALARAAC